MSVLQPVPSGMPVATGIFLAANAAIYVVLAILAGGLDIPGEVIAEAGGLLPLAWLGTEYWRVLSYGFLHFSLMHLAVNSLCLLVWGVPIERRFGALNMSLLYLGSIVLAGIGSILLHQKPFISAGASGGVSGLLGALFFLFLMRRTTLPLSYFAINIGLNIAVALFVPGIDWQAHLAGFLGGVVLMLAILALSRR